MKQVLQDLKTGRTSVLDIPSPEVIPGHLLIRSSATVISAGTERMLLEFGKAGLLQKIRQQPEKVRQVMQKVKTDGLLPTLSAVQNKLDKPLTMGYANAGMVIAVGEGVREFSLGDRVVSNGNHAEIVLVPKNLCAKIPPQVCFESASYTVLGAIALQGIRLATPTLGETCVVMGLGIIGLLTVQLLVANGCRVIASDYDADRLALAQGFGAQVVNRAENESLEQACASLSSGQGIDAVLITASTKSSEPVSQAATVCRKRGRIVLVGVTGLELSRSDFYKKELSFQVSCSYGPGRYESNYEEKGLDYPIGFVRWTEQRNFEAVLQLMSEGRVNSKALTTHTFSIDEAEKAYDLIGKKSSVLGVLLTYPEAPTTTDQAQQSATSTAAKAEPPRSPEAESRNQQVTDPQILSPKTISQGRIEQERSTPSLACIGAGNYASAVLIPAFKKADANLYAVISQRGASAQHLARKFGFETTLNGSEEAMQSSKVDALVISTRHDSHAELVQSALKAGKQVFVEKPLCLNLSELEHIAIAYKEASMQAGEGSAELAPPPRAPRLMVGFNRRYSAHVQKIASLLKRVKEPISMIMTVNAGFISQEHWIHDPEIGGGRIIGEACHFIDLLRFLASSKIAKWTRAELAGFQHDTLSITLEFENGSIGCIHYFANGSKSFPKERLEIFAGKAILQLDNFRKMRGYGWPGFAKMNLSRQDKGQTAMARAFCSSLSGDSSSVLGLIPVDELFEVAKVSIEIANG